MVDYYTKLVANIIFPIHERLKGHTSVVVRRSMEKSQWLGKKELQDLQMDRLKSLLVQAEEKSPYYKEMFKKYDFNPRSVNSVKDIRKLPVLTKAIIKKNSDLLKSSDNNRLVKSNTGGSTGEPLVFYLGMERISHDIAAKWRATKWWGVDIGDREVVIWGSPIELLTQDKIKIVRDKLLRSYLFPAFEMSEAKIMSFVEIINKNTPAMLFGYPSALAHIANFVKERSIKLNSSDLKVIFVTSERLYDWQRDIIEDVFNCPVANGYGGRDAGFIAHQCPEGSMHITAEDIIVEIVDDDDNPVAIGESGEIVVTHLASGDYPFIRYKTGDVGVLDDKQCKCGRGLPVLKSIEGRETDFIIKTDGSVMHGLALIYILRELDGIKKFKITQETLREYFVDIVVEASYQPIWNQNIVAGFKQRLGEDISVEIRIVDEIQSEKSGKFRYVVSKVKC